MARKPSKARLKYNEEKILAEVRDYVLFTYGKHYSLANGIQALDLIFSSGHGKAYCASNCIKYYARYGRKAGFNRDDILKAVHYGILLLYLDMEENK